MSGLVHFLRCVGRAVLRNGGKALAGLIPLGEVTFEIARDAYLEYRQSRNQADLRADLEQLAQTPAAQVRQVAAEVIATEAIDQPVSVQLALESYLEQIPAAIRLSLRRPSDPAGGTIPYAQLLDRVEDLLPFLPASMPRFRPGDRPLAADWELVELLGKGGFGEVWKARHLTRSTQKPVALKFCLDPLAAESLRNEATLHDLLDRLRQQQQQGIVPLLETFLRADPPCLMYEYIEGGDLTAFVHEAMQQGILTPSLATRIVARLAGILGAAHAHTPPLVHRDLKLSNILVRPGKEALPELFVTDFGIGGLAADQTLQQKSRPTTHRLTLPLALRGAYTPLYASPQQIQGDRPDPRDDVHALGVIWYQLLTGDLKLMSIPPDWREVVEERGLSPELTNLLATCIASRAEKRPAHAGELAERLTALLPTLRTPAKPPGPMPLTGEPVQITGPRRTYTLRELLAAGDVADVFTATAPSEASDKAESLYTVKVSRVPEGHVLLNNERLSLVHLLTAAADTTYRKYLPLLAESFPAADRFKKRVNVFVHEPGFYTLEQVHAVHPALDGRHLAWIFKRLLIVLGFCHRQQTVHGAVLPCHVLLHPENHGLQLIGWGQSVPAGQPLTTIATRYRGWYPPEVLKRQPAGPATDLFLAARCLIYLAGGDAERDLMPSSVPVPLQRFLRGCLLAGVKMRPDDAWKLNDEFDDLLRQLYGPPKFFPLTMNKGE